MFTSKGVVEVEKATAPDEDHLLEIALEAGAEDLRDAESSWEITTDPSSMRGVGSALEAAGVPIASAEITMLPQTTVPVDGGGASQVLGLIELLGDLVYVQNVYANFAISEAIMAVWTDLIL